MHQDDKIVSPPYSNTGVERTNEKSLESSVDWLEGTFFGEKSEDEIFDYLNLKKDEFTEMATGQNGYKDGYRFGDITILYNGKEEMGTHFIMTGKGCRQYEFVHREKDQALGAVIKQVLDSDGKLSRLDLAIDDYHGYFRIPFLATLIKKGALVSRFKKARKIEDILIKDGSTKGTTLYFGSASSDIMIRMYEKNYQMGVEDKIPVWNRTEIQLRNDKASKAAGYIIEGKPLGEVVLGILSNYIRFVKLDGKDSNKRRAKTHPQWEKFLGDVEKLKLTQKPEPPDMNKKQAWLIDQVSKTFAMVTKVNDDREAFMHSLFEIGKERMKEIDKAVVQTEVQKRNMQKQALEEVAATLEAEAEEEWWRTHCVFCEKLLDDGNRAHNWCDPCCVECDDRLSRESEN